MSNLADVSPGWRAPAPLAARFRDPVNGFMHLAALLLSLAGTLVLLRAAGGDALKLLTVAIYGISMCGCFLASSLHHLVRGERELEMRLLRLDQAAIYPFIAGTYTPVCIHVLPAPGSYFLLAVVWAIALSGLVYRLGFARDPARVEDPPHAVDTVFYVAMGWQIMWQGSALLERSAGGTFWLAVAGGALYTLGGVVLTRRLLDFRPGRIGHHEIWHAFVMAGAACFYAYLFLNLT